ncbi:uncharacterized protein LY89DRAFT_742378 [Mollisia scopiformis]|uniref:Uncharacterized protein n=1 Tax=Mollisia scopiformis TaxID=149040 RepID=A0A132B879_MOLSC|nr:uncharacterized protein LY89DRAFT_742378 [Mollisia scopiformis]KUJ08084.1 hypothetical protein LY89DRAFT_742378 [Mollisia scopiformis]
MEIAELQQDGLIGSHLELDNIVSTLSSRSQGMFLWARLMSCYLECKALSPDEREEAIFTVELVEGLESLYQKILFMLRRGYRKSGERLKRIFSLMSTSTSRLTVTQLRIALAIKPGKATKQSQLIENLERDLPIICGSLVEVYHSRVQFVITTPELRFITEPFFVDRSQAYQENANLCLSYVIYDIPKGPLGSTRAKEETTKDLNNRFPFLERSLAWMQHATASLSERSNLYGGNNYEKLRIQFLSLLSAFMDDPLSVTTWIEAAWSFNSKPVIDCLVYKLSPADTMDSTPRVLEDATYKKLGDFGHDLRKLCDEWEHLLKHDPGSIWRPSITAFTKSSFWSNTTDTIVSSLAPEDVMSSSRDNTSSVSGHAILVQSQISHQTGVLGIVMVLPSRQVDHSYMALFKSLFPSPREKSTLSPLTEAEESNLIQFASKGWSIKYQQRSIQTEGLILELEHGLCEDQVQELLTQSIASGQPDRFPFPIAFSKSLNRLLVLRTLLTLDINTSDGYCLKAQTFQRDPKNTHSYCSIFSDSEKALAFVSGRTSITQVMQQNVQIWSEEDDSGKDAEFRKRGTVTVSWLNPRESSSSICTPGFIFHPTLPLIVFAEWTHVSLWWYNKHKRSERTPIISGPASPLEFVDKCVLLYTIWIQEQDRLTADEKKRSQRMKDKGPYSDIDYDDPASFDNCAPSVQSFPAIDLTEVINSVISVLSISSLTTLPAASTPTLSTHSTTFSSKISGLKLWQESSKNAVILEIGEDDSSESCLLSHLPRLTSGEKTFISLLGFMENDRWLKLVWNKGPQESYCLGDTPHPYLPSIISRKPESIEYEDWGRKAIEGARPPLKALLANPMGTSAKEQTEQGRQWSTCSNCRYACQAHGIGICLNNLIQNEEN